MNDKEPKSDRTQSEEFCIKNTIGISIPKGNFVVKHFFFDLQYS